MRRFFLLFCLYIATMCSTLFAQPKYEVRATWLTTLGGLDWPTAKATNAMGIAKQKNELCDILDRLQKAHINTVLLQVRTRGAVIYPSKYEPFDAVFSGKIGLSPQYDPLAFAIEECHKRGLELHAWLVCMPVGTQAQIRSLGRQSIVEKRGELCKQHQGAWYMDPGLPETARYLRSLVGEIIQQYDVDGIHLDYIRYPENASAFKDATTYQRYGTGKSKDAWRRDNITHIVKEIHTEVKHQKPWVKVSSAPIGKFADTPRYSSKGWNAFYTVYQDVKQWLAMGIQDAIFPMMYFSGNQFYPFALDWVEHSAGRFVVPGLGIYFLSQQERNWHLDEIRKQIYFSRGIGAMGQAYFRNKFLLNDTKGLLSELQENVYAYPAYVPPMKWEKTSAISSPTSLVATLQGALLNLSWTPSISSQDQVWKYRVYASDTYPVDVEKAENIVGSTNRAETTFRYSLTPTHRQKVFWAITAVDRFGNESTPLQMELPTAVQNYAVNALPKQIPTGGYILFSDATGKVVLRTQQLDTPALHHLKGFLRYTLYDEAGKLLQTGILCKQ